MIIELEHVGVTVDLPEPDIKAADRLAYLLHYSNGPERVMEGIRAHLRDTAEPLPLYAGLTAPDPLTTSTVMLLEDLQRFTAAEDARRAVCAPVTEEVTGAVKLSCAAHGWIANVQHMDGQADVLDRIWFDHVNPNGAQ